MLQYCNISEDNLIALRPQVSQKTSCVKPAVHYSYIPFHLVTRGLLKSWLTYVDSYYVVSCIRFKMRKKSVLGTRVYTILTIYTFVCMYIICPRRPSGLLEGNLHTCQSAEVVSSILMKNIICFLASVAESVRM